MRYFLIIFAVLVIFSCSKTSSSGNDIPRCVQSAIDSCLARPKNSLYVSINAYQYNGAAVYLYYVGCCDGFNQLRDTNCNFLFSPSGGITGGGDHTHPNFFNEAKFIKTVWVDPRP